MDSRMFEVLNEVFTPVKKAIALYLFEHPDVDQIDVYRDGSWCTVKHAKTLNAKYEVVSSRESIVSPEKFKKTEHVVYMSRYDLMDRAFEFYIRCLDRGCWSAPVLPPSLIRDKLRDCLKEDRRDIRAKDLKPGMFVYVNCGLATDLLCEVVEDRKLTPPLLLLITQKQKPNYVLTKFVKSTEKCWPHFNTDQVDARFTFRAVPNDF